MTRTLGKRAAAKAIGTFFLVFIGPGAVMVDAYTGGTLGHAGVALAFGSVVTAMIFALGHPSGAHINPAVTIAFWSTRRFPPGDVIPYLVAQCAGAVGASLVRREHESGAVTGATPWWAASGRHTGSTGRLRLAEWRSRPSSCAEP